MGLSDYPTALDSFYDPQSGDVMDGSPETHSEVHSKANDALTALESFLGTSGSPGPAIQGLADAAAAQYILTEAVFGGKADGVLVTDFATTASSTTVTSAKITASDNGKTVVIDGAGGSGAVLVATLSGCTVGQGVMSLAASVTLTAGQGVLATDDTTAWNNMLAAWYAGGGGVMQWKGITLVTGQLLIPNDGHLYTSQNGLGPPNPSPNYVGPWQPPGRIQGFGAYWDGQWGGTLTGDTSDPHQPGGSILVTTCASNPAIFTAGTGLLELRGFTLMMLTPDGVYGVLTTNTTVIAEKGAVTGRPTKSRATCTQNVFKLGGSATQVTTDITGGFQGYGTVIRDWYFDRICHAVEDGSAAGWANGLIFDRLTISRTCGSTSSGDAPVVLQQGINHRLRNLLLEGTGYANGYGAMLTNVTQSIVDQIFTVDETSGFAGQVYFGAGSTDNLVIAGYRDTAAPAIVEDSSVVGTNRLVSPYQIDQGQCSMTSTLTGTSMPIGYPPGDSTVCSLNSVVYDPAGMADTTNFQIVIKIAGRYHVTGQVAYGDSTTQTGPTSGQVATFVVVNGVDTVLGGRFQASGYLSVAAAAGMLNLKVGDKVQLRLYQLSGSTQYVYGPNCQLSVALQ